LKAYSQILSVKINIGYVDLVAQVGFLDKSRTCHSHGIEPILAGAMPQHIFYTVCPSCRTIRRGTGEFSFLITV